MTTIEKDHDRVRERYLRPIGERPESSARGLHHTALVSSNVERTVRFYQDVPGFPLTELIENRAYPGSCHYFLDIGNGNLLAVHSDVSVCFTDPDGGAHRAHRRSAGEMYGSQGL